MKNHPTKKSPLSHNEKRMDYKFFKQDLQISKKLEVKIQKTIKKEDLEITTFPSLCWNIHHILRSKATAVNLPDKHYKPRLSRHGRRHMFQVYHQGIVAVQQNIEKLHQAAPSIGPMGRLADFRCPRGRSGFSVKLVGFRFLGRKKNRMFPWELREISQGFFHSFLSIIFFPKSDVLAHLSGVPGKTPKNGALSFDEKKPGKISISLEPGQIDPSIQGRHSSRCK